MMEAGTTAAETRREGFSFLILTETPATHVGDLCQVPRSVLEFRVVVLCCVVLGWVVGLSCSGGGGVGGGLVSAVTEGESSERTSHFQFGCQSLPRNNCDKHKSKITDFHAQARRNSVHSLSTPARCSMRLCLSAMDVDSFRNYLPRPKRSLSPSIWVSYSFCAQLCLSSFRTSTRRRTQPPTARSSPTSRSTTNGAISAHVNHVLPHPASSDPNS